MFCLFCFVVVIVVVVVCLFLLGVWDAVVLLRVGKDSKGWAN